MGDIIVPRNYTSFTHAADFCSLCSPVFNQSDVDECFYVKLYRDGTYFDLNTFQKMEEYLLFDAKVVINLDVNYFDAAFANNDLRINNSNKICAFLEEQSVCGGWHEAFEEFNVSSMFIIAEKFDEYYEVFGFTTRFGKTIYAFCMNHFDVLENFIAYFRRHSKGLVSIAEQNKIILFNNSPNYSKLVELLRRSVNDNITLSRGLKSHELSCCLAEKQLTEIQLSVLQRKYSFSDFKH